MRVTKRDHLAAAAPTIKSSIRPYLGLSFLTGLNLFNYLDRYVLASVVPPIKAELQLSDGEIGWLTSAFMIGYFATAPIFGYLGDRWRRKGLIAFGVAVWSLGTILTGFCHQYWTLFACRALVGLGEASYATLAPAWLSDLFPAGRRNSALTIFYAAIPLGSALGYLVGGFALAHGGWRSGFLWAGVPGLLLATALWLLNEPPRSALNADALEGSPGSFAKPGFAGIAGLFRIGDFNLILLGYTAYTFALGAFAAWGPTFLNRAHGLELGVADKFFGGVLVIAGLFGTLIGGFAATAWRRRTRAGYALLLTVAVAIAVPVAVVAFLDVGTTLSMACLAVAMFLTFLPTGPITTLLIESVPATLRASAMAASIFVIHLFGDFWSPVVVGELADWASQSGQPDIGLRHAMFILPAVLSLAAVFWGWVARRQQARTEA
jgi:MFS transporter, Spinster family, sphingosine-1-phosphate transporter